MAKQFPDKIFVWRQESPEWKGDLGLVAVETVEECERGEKVAVYKRVSIKTVDVTLK